MKNHELLPDLPGMEHTTLPADVRLAMCRHITRNPYADAKVEFLGRKLPGEYTLGEFMVPCPCCGDLMVTLQELPGLFPSTALLVETEDGGDD